MRAHRTTRRSNKNVCSWKRQTEPFLDEAPADEAFGAVPQSSNPLSHGGSIWKNVRTSLRRSCRRIATVPSVEINELGKRSWTVQNKSSFPALLTSPLKLSLRRLQLAAVFRRWKDRLIRHLTSVPSPTAGMNFIDLQRDAFSTKIIHEFRSLSPHPLSHNRLWRMVFANNVDYFPVRVYICGKTHHRRWSFGYLRMESNGAPE